MARVYMGAIYVSMARMVDTITRLVRGSLSAISLKLLHFRDQLVQDGVRLHNDALKNGHLLLNVKCLVDWGLSEGLRNLAVHCPVSKHLIISLRSIA